MSNTNPVRILKGLYEHRKLFIREILRLKNFPMSNREHIDAALEWLCFAQDVSGDGGVSAGFNLIKNRWLPSYPETTGYIIPTFFDYYHMFGNEEIKKRAIRMAEWEVGIQLECGGFQSGTVGTEKRIPAIFDTGQVILGLASAYRETQNRAFLFSLERAADWLCDVQDEDGAWRKYSAWQVINHLNVYNTRVAWALMVAYDLVRKERYRFSAVKNIKWSLTQQKENGWFYNNDFEKNDRPLTHTIAYTISGILETGLCLKNNEFLSAAIKTANALIAQQRKDGSLAGRYKEDWTPAVKWTCLTGDAQMSVVWLKLYKLTGENKYLDAARKMNAFLKRVQEMSTNDRNLKGAIKGSYPIYGGYEPWFYPSWAAKFFIDAVILEEEVLCVF